MKFILAFTVFAIIFAVTILNVEAIPTHPSLTTDSSINPTTIIENIRNKRDVMIYDWGCEGDACDRDCKGRNFRSGHCTPYALINVRCWCVPK